MQILIVNFNLDGLSEEAFESSCDALAPAGRLVSGFNLGRNYSLPELDRHGVDNGLVLEDRFATWDRQPWIDGGDYAVSVHRRPR